jgi:uncharacterized membrane protein
MEDARSPLTAEMNQRLSDLRNCTEEVKTMSVPMTDVPFVASTPTASDMNRVDAAAPFAWIRRGIDDFRQAPGLSLLYGFLFAGLCAGVYLLIRGIPGFTTGYLTGLLVAGPFLAAGLYVASRDIERGSAPSVASSLGLLVQRRTYLALFSLMLALVMAAWIRFSALLFAIKFNTLTPTAEAYTQMLASSEGWITLSYFVGIGFLLAATVFVVSAVAIPLILDKDADFITAMQKSYRAVVSNPLAMLVWAGLIVALTAIGIATAFVGLAVIFPVLGYATWHSYRTLVK